MTCVVRTFSSVCLLSEPRWKWTLVHRSGHRSIVRPTESGGGDSGVTVDRSLVLVWYSTLETFSLLFQCLLNQRVKNGRTKSRDSEDSSLDRP